MPEKERRHSEQQLEFLDNKPEWHEQKDPDEGNIARMPRDRYITNFMHVSPEGEAYLDSNFQEDANLERIELRKETALRLKNKYPLLWGKRGMPKVIAFEENLHPETIRKYFKDFP